MNIENLNFGTNQLTVNRCLSLHKLFRIISHYNLLLITYYTKKLIINKKVIINDEKKDDEIGKENYKFRNRHKHLHNN